MTTKKNIVNQNYMNFASNIMREQIILSKIVTTIITENASQAMSFHKNMMKRKNFYSQTLSVEKNVHIEINGWTKDEVADELD